jgi:hypothetical protein
MNHLTGHQIDPIIHSWLLAANGIRLWKPVGIRIVEHIIYKDEEIPPTSSDEFEMYACIRSREPLEVSISSECRCRDFHHYPNEEKVDEAIARAIMYAFQNIGQRDIEVQIIRYAKPNTERVEACITIRVPKKNR